MDKVEMQNGSITLETCIVLPIFFFLFLFIDGIFIIFTAQNEIMHALVQSSKSLSLDAYLTENVESAAEEQTRFWGGLSDAVLDMVRLTKDKYYTSQTDWYETDNVMVAKNRFIGYFAGGDESLAAEKLEILHVKDGLNGITYSMEKDGEDYTFTISYSLQYWFDFFDMGEIPIKQSYTTRLWK